MLEKHLEELITKYLSNALNSIAFKEEKTLEEIKELFNNVHVKYLIKKFDVSSVRAHYETLTDNRYFGKNENFYNDFGLPYYLLNRNNDVLTNLQKELNNEIFNSILYFIKIFTPKKLNNKLKYDSEHFQNIFLNFLFKDFSNDINRNDKYIIFKLENDNTFNAILSHTISIIEKLVFNNYRKALTNFLIDNIIKLELVIEENVLRTTLDFKLSYLPIHKIIQIIEDEEKFNELIGEINV